MVPEPPVNVRLVLTDGSEYPVDTVYVGIEDGLHVWQVVTGPPLERVTGLNIDRLPGRTQVTIAEGYFSG